MLAGLESAWTGTGSLDYDLDWIAAWPWTGMLIGSEPVLDHDLDHYRRCCLAGLALASLSMTLTLDFPSGTVKVIRMRPNENRFAIVPTPVRRFFVAAIEVNEGVQDAQEVVESVLDYIPGSIDVYKGRLTQEKPTVQSPERPVLRPITAGLGSANLNVIHPITPPCSGAGSNVVNGLIPGPNPSLGTNTLAVPSPSTWTWIGIDSVSKRLELPCTVAFTPAKTLERFNKDNLVEPKPRGNFAGIMVSACDFEETASSRHWRVVFKDGHHNTFTSFFFTNDKDVVKGKPFCLKGRSILAIWLNAEIHDWHPPTKRGTIGYKNPTQAFAGTYFFFKDLGDATDEDKLLIKRANASA